MPLGQAKLPDAEIATIREWIQGGLLETAASLPKGPVGPSAAYRGTDLISLRVRRRCRNGWRP